MINSPSTMKRSNCPSTLKLPNQFLSPNSSLPMLQLQPRKSSLMSIALSQTATAPPNKRPSNFSNQSNTEYLRDLSLFYVETASGKPIRHRLDFNTPRTKEAAGQLGVTFEDCVARQRSEFFRPGVDQKVAELRYNHHRIKVQKTLKSVYELRKQIITKNYKLAIENEEKEKKLARFEANIKEEGKKALVRPYEKKAMLEFVEKSRKEISILESEERRQELLSKMSKTSKKSEANQSFTLKKPNSILSLRNSVQAGLQHNVEPFYKTVANLKRLASETLKKQVKERAEGALKVAASLRAFQDKQAEAERKFLSESQTIDSRLSEIMSKIERASDKREGDIEQKRLAAVRVGPPVDQVNEKAVLMNLERRMDYEVQYAKKVEAIEKSKRIKEKTLKDIKKEKEKKLLMKKKAQDEKYKELLQKKQKEVQLIEEDLRKKEDAQKRIVLESMMDEEDDYFKEKKLLSQELQKENYARVLRINEYRRKKILEKHQFLKEKNSIKKFHTSLMQDYAINKNFSEQEATKAIHELLTKLKKTDLQHSGQRQRLFNTLMTLNNQFNLRLPLEHKPSKPKKTNEETDESEEVEPPKSS